MDEVVGRSVMWHGADLFLPAADDHHHSVVTTTAEIEPGITEVGHGVPIQSGDVGTIVRQLAPTADGAAICEIQFAAGGLLTAVVPQPSLTFTARAIPAAVPPATLYMLAEAVPRRRYAERQPRPSRWAKVLHQVRSALRPAGPHP